MVRAIASVRSRKGKIIARVVVEGDDAVRRAGEELAHQLKAQGVAKKAQRSSYRRKRNSDA